MSNINSSADHLTLNADGAGKDIKFQANGVEVASIDSTGALTVAGLTSTGIDDNATSTKITVSDSNVGLSTQLNIERNAVNTKSYQKDISGIVGGMNLTESSFIHTGGGGGYTNGAYGFVKTNETSRASAYVVYVADNDNYSASTDERMRIDSGGRVTIPNQPFFSGRLPSGTTKAAGWTYPSNTFSTVDANVGNHYDTTTGLFTCPVTGDYEVKTGGFVSTAGDGTRYGPMLRRNGSDIQIGGFQLSVGDTPAPLNSYIVSCSANDTLRWDYAYCPVAVTYNAGAYGFVFQVRLLG